MLKKGVVALFVVVTMSAIIIGAFAISINKNPSNNIGSNQLTPLSTPLNNTSSANSNGTVPNVDDSVNNGKTSNTNGVVSPNTKTDNKNVPAIDSVRFTSEHNANHLSSVNIISPAEAQKIAAQYIEQAGATPGTPDLVSQDGKKVYIVPVMLNNTIMGEIDIDAQDGI